MTRTERLRWWVLYTVFCYVALLVVLGAEALLLDVMASVSSGPQAGRMARLCWLGLSWLSVPLLVALGLLVSLPDRVQRALAVLFWVVFGGWIAWNFYRQIRAWWRQREQDTLTRHRMVLMRLDHLEERVKRLGRAIQGPDTLADDADDAEAPEEAPVHSGGFDALRRERRTRAVPAALQVLEQWRWIKARLWLVRWPGLVCLVGLGAGVMLNQFYLLPDWLYVVGVVLTWGGVVSGLVAVFMVALETARQP